jgi:hypothetical protein
MAVPLAASNLTADGSTGPLSVVTGATVTLHASGLESLAPLMLHAYPAGCTGTPESSTLGIVEVDGTFETTATQSTAGTRGYQIQVGGTRSNCVLVTWAIPSLPLITVNGSTGPVTVYAGATVDIVLGSLGANRTVFLQQGQPTCSQNATTILTTSSGASGTVETQVTLDTPGQVGFRASTSAPASTGCVLVNVVAPVSPTLTVNDSTGPVEATAGESLIARVAGLTPNGGLTAYLYRGASTCDGSPTEEVGWTADPNGQWGEQRSVEVGTLAIAVRDGTTGLLSNCVVVTGQPLPTATPTTEPTATPTDTPTATTPPTATATTPPTATLTATATSTATATLTASPTPTGTFEPTATPTETVAPSETPTTMPTEPVERTAPSTSTAPFTPGVAVTTLPSTGQGSASPANPGLLLLAGAGLLFLGAVVSLRRHQRCALTPDPPRPSH